MADEIYDWLGVKADATDEEIRIAYRRNAKAAHPDRNGGDTSKMTKVNKAYAVLGNAQKRLTYDRTGEVDKKHEDVAVHDMVVGHVMGWLDADDDKTSGDMVADIVGAFRRQMAEQQALIAQNEHTLFKLKTRLKRLKRKKKTGEDIIKMSAEHRIRELRQMNERIVDQCALFKKAIVMISEYEYEREVPLGRRYTGLGGLLG